LKETEGKKSDYLDMLKLNYRQRIQQVQNFSENFSENSLGLRSEFLTGVLELFQYYIDLQKKFISRYPKWYDDNLMIRNSQMITEMFTQTTHNVNSFYSEFFDYLIKNMRTVNRIGMQMMQTSERYYDMFENIPPLQKNMLVELIKEAKQLNDTYVKKSIGKTRSQNQKIDSKKEVLAKDAS